MLKQKFRLLKAPKNNALFIFSCALIMLFGFVVILPAVPASTYAEGDVPEEGISVVASSDISVNLLSKDEGYYKIFKDSIKVSTSSENGYTLSIATDSADHQTLYLNGDTTSESKIDGASGTYEEPKALDDYEWGFAVPGISRFDDTYSTTEPSTNSKFAILPLENKIIRDYTEAATDNITDIYYGFKLGGALELGEYRTTVTYTAISATQPLTVKAVLGNNGNLNFLYDRNTYTVGGSYTDNIGETEISAIYDAPVNSGSDNKPGWTNNNSIESANFEPSFYNFKPTSTAYWFYYDTSLGTITQAANLNTSNVTDMSYMFSYAGNYVLSLNLDLSGWDTSKTTNMSYMFFDTGHIATTWNIDGINDWNTSNVTSMSNMFNRAGWNATNFSLNLNKWDVSSVTDMAFMFYSAGNNSRTFNLNISNWKTSNVVDMSDMFFRAGYYSSTWSVGDLGDWDVSNVTNMSGMFARTGDVAAIWTIGDIGGWNTSKVTTMYEMFYLAGPDATTWTVGDLSGWDVSSVTSMADMFNYTGQNANTWDIGNLNYVDEEHKGWDVSNVVSHSDFVNWNQANIDTSKLPWQSD